MRLMNAMLPVLCLMPWVLVVGLLDITTPETLEIITADFNSTTCFNGTIVLNVFDRFASLREQDENYFSALMKIGGFRPSIRKKNCLVLDKKIYEPCVFTIKTVQKLEKKLKIQYTLCLEILLS